jgi:hypothetical protein
MVCTRLHTIRMKKYSNKHVSIIISTKLKSIICVKVLNSQNTFYDYDIEQELSYSFVSQRNTHLLIPLRVPIHLAQHVFLIHFPLLVVILLLTFAF